MSKRQIHITIDCDLYDSAKTKYGNLSGRINELLSMDLYGSDEKAELVNRLHELQLEEKSITKRICELEHSQNKVEIQEANKEKILDWVRDVYSRNGVIGLDKVKSECDRHKVNFEDIKMFLESEGIATVNYEGGLK